MTSSDWKVAMNHDKAMNHDELTIQLKNVETENLELSSKLKSVELKSADLDDKNKGSNHNES